MIFASPSAALRAWTASAPVSTLTPEIVVIEWAMGPVPSAA